MSSSGRGSRSGKRLVSFGDVAPRLTPRSIENQTVAAKVDGARESTAGATLDVLQDVAPSDTDRLMKAIEAILDGASADDQAALRKALLRSTKIANAGLHAGPDQELSEDWRNGAYSYKYLMQRRTYEREKYRLQVELLKLQA